MNKISILLVDDNAILAEAMPLAITHDPRFTWAGWIANGDHALEHIANIRPNIVLMDIDMPGVNTFSLVHKIIENCACTKVVMFSGHIREDYTDAAYEAGAYGYLSKDDEFSSILDNLERAHQGHMVLSKSLERYLLGRG